MAKVRIGINGFGRIGRGFVRCLAESKGNFELVLINDLTDVETLGHLLKHDSVHGQYPGTVEVKDGSARHQRRHTSRSAPRRIRPRSSGRTPASTS